MVTEKAGWPGSSASSTEKQTPRKRSKKNRLERENMASDGKFQPMRESVKAPGDSMDLRGIFNDCDMCPSYH